MSEKKPRVIWVVASKEYPKNVAIYNFDSRKEARMWLSIHNWGKDWNVVKFTEVVEKRGTK